MVANAWSGTSLDAAKRLVSALPAAPRSRALRDLQFKVLVSNLALPGGATGSAPSLFSRKVDRLAAMGEGESLNEMVRAAGAYTDPWVAATVVDAMMMAGERAGACSIVVNHDLQQPFGQRAETACQAVAGDPVPARDAPQPAGQLDGPAFVLLDLARARLPAAVLLSTQPPTIRALVAFQSLPLASRIEVAERGEALAIIEATRLADLYLQAIREGAPLPAAMARRARLVATARNASDARQLVSSITAVYGETRGTPLFATVARASASALLSLPAQPAYADIAQEAMRGFLLLGDRQLTLAWTQLALGAVANSARAIMALDRLMPLVVVAGVDKRRLTAQEVDRWYEVTREDDVQRAPLHAYVMLQLLRATGVDLPPGSTSLPEAPPGNARLVMPAQATLQALQAAGAGRRRAEAALLASIAIGETALADLHPAAVGTIVRALRDAGEDDAARLFAVEIAIAHGL